MCRLMAYMGEPILLAHVILWPDRSIIKQSYDAKERLLDLSLPSHLAHGNLNGDGFGIGWFSPEAAETSSSSCVFTSVTPAWNNENLSRLSGNITSPLVFAHVRAAYPGMPVSEQNCHPFQWGRYMWMHNGGVAGFLKIRRHLLETLSDEAYNAVQSFHSDSAVSFAVFLNHLPDMKSQLPPEVMLQAMERTLATIDKVQQKCGIVGVSLMNFVVSDGWTMIATRFVSPETEEPASLYYAEGNRFRPSRSDEQIERNQQDMQPSSLHSEATYELSYAERGTQVAMVASEPITGSGSDWVKIPKNTALIISREKSGFVNIMRAAVTSSGTHPQQGEVSRCLEAVSRAIGVTARPWSLRKKPSIPSGVDEFDGTVAREEGHKLTGHSSAVLCIALDKNKERLFSGSLDGFIKVWDLKEHSLIRTLEGHRKPVIKLHMNNNFLFSTAGLRIRVWNVDTYACLYVAGTQSGTGTIRALGVANNTVYMGNQDTHVKSFLLNPSRFVPECETVRDDDLIEWNSCTEDLHSHLSVINSLEVCGDYVCSAGGDAMVRVWQLGTLKPVHVLRGHRGSILTVKSIGNMLLSGGRDNNIRVWDMEALLCRRTLMGHKDDIMHITVLCSQSAGISKGHHRRCPSIVPDGPCIVASASADCTVRLWSAISWSTLRIFDLGPPDPGHDLPSDAKNSYSCTTTPLALGLTPTHLVAGTRDGALIVWPVEDVVDRVRSSCIEELDTQLSGPNDMRDICKEVVNGGCDMEILTKKMLERELERNLKEFVSIKTVSGDPSCREDCFKGAKFLAHLLEDLGAEVKLVQPFEDKNPVIVGCLGHNRDANTVTFYGHYDVQPAMETQWKTDPFKVHSVDGYLYGRGTSDNKGPILAFIYAIKEILESAKGTESSGVQGLPLNISFIFEGEEENGSIGTEEAMLQNIHWFKNTTLSIISNTQWVGEVVPCLTYGMRGMISLNVEVVGSNRDLHSGNDGGVFNEPLVDLVHVLSTLVDSHNSIQVPGFYDYVKTTLLDAAWPDLELSKEFSVESYQDALEVPALISQGSKKELLNLRWCQPTLSVVDVRPGTGSQSRQEAQDGQSLTTYHRFGPSRFSVIPGSAVGKVSVRFVPEQDKSYLVNCIRAHIEHEFAKLRSRNEVKVTVVTAGDWWDASTSSEFFGLAQQAIVEEWEQQPLCVREGGTMPMASVLEKILGAPALLIPMGQASDNCHLANERIRMLNLLKGKNVICRLLKSIAKYRTPN